MMAKLPRLRAVPVAVAGDDGEVLLQLDVAQSLSALEEKDRKRFSVIPLPVPEAEADSKTPECELVGRVWQRLSVEVREGLQEVGAEAIRALVAEHFGEAAPSGG